MGKGEAMDSVECEENNILYWILALMGSQWNSARMGVMWFCFFDLETSAAAEFWILCSFV